MRLIFVILISWSLTGIWWSWPKIIARIRPVASAPEDPSLAIWREMIGVIEADLLEHPDDWGSDGYDLKNAKRGVSIWIANQDYGLSVSVGGGTLRGNKGDIPLAEEDKKRLWRMVQARIASAVVNRFRDKGSGI